MFRPLLFQAAEGGYTQSGLWIYYNGNQPTRSGSPVEGAWEDLTGNNNDTIGTVGNPTFTLNNWGLDGLDSGFILPTNVRPMLDSRSFTIEFLIEPSILGATDLHTLFSMGDSNGYISVKRDGTSNMEAILDWNGTQIITDNSIIPAAKISTFSIVVTPTQQKFYIDGELLDTKSETLSDISLLTNILYLGKNISTGNSFFGNMYSFRLYDRPLSDQEVENNSKFDGEEFPVLPEGYTSVEWIESNKQQCINTDMIDENGNHDVYLDFLLPTANNRSTTLVGSRYDNPIRRYGNFYFPQDLTAGFWIGSSTSVMLTTLQANKRYRMKFNVIQTTGQITMDLDGSVTSANFAGSALIPGPVYLFGCNLNGSITERPAMRLFGAKFWNDRILVRNFVPVLDDQGVACLYDRVSKQPFYTMGTAPFTYGL